MNNRIIVFKLFGYGFSLIARITKSTNSEFEINSPFYSYRKRFGIPIPSCDNDLTIRARIKNRQLMLRIHFNN